MEQEITSPEDTRHPSQRIVEELFSWEGKLGRLAFFVIYHAGTLAFFFGGLSAMASWSMEKTVDPIAVSLSLGGFWFVVSSSIKRLRDIGVGGWRAAVLGILLAIPKDVVVIFTLYGAMKSSETGVEIAFGTILIIIFLGLLAGYAFLEGFSARAPWWKRILYSAPFVLLLAFPWPVFFWPSKSDQDPGEEHSSEEDDIRTGVETAPSIANFCDCLLASPWTDLFASVTIFLFLKLVALLNPFSLQLERFGFSHDSGVLGSIAILGDSLVNAVLTMLFFRWLLQGRPFHRISFVIFGLFVYIAGSVISSLLDGGTLWHTNSLLSTAIEMVAVIGSLLAVAEYGEGIPDLKRTTWALIAFPVLWYADVLMGIYIFLGLGLVSWGEFITMSPHDRMDVPPVAAISVTLAIVGSVVMYAFFLLSPERNVSHRVWQIALFWVILPLVASALVFFLVNKRFPVDSLIF